MANSNRPSGLSPVQYINGSPWNGQARTYFIASGDTNAYAIGDPVASSGSADANGVPGVTIATGGSGNALRGVVVSAGGLQDGGPHADPTNLNTIVVPATKTKAYYVMVADDPRILFEAQEDSDTNNIAASMVGLNIDLISAANNGYISGWQLDSSSSNSGSTRQMRLWGLVRRPDNAIGQYAKWLVSINNHELLAGVAGV